MIFFEIDNAAFDASAPIAECLDFYKKAVAENLPRGRYELSDGAYCSITEQAPVTEENDFFEAHRKYVDLHAIISGSQNMKLGFTDALQFDSYTEEKDFVKIIGAPYSVVPLTPGTAICLFPNDAHWITVSNTGDTVKKIIFKIPVGLFETK